MMHSTVNQMNQISCFQLAELNSAEMNKIVSSICGFSQNFIRLNWRTVRRRLAAQRASTQGHEWRRPGTTHRQGGNPPPPHPCPTGHPPKWVGSWSRPVGGGCRWPPRDAVGRPVALLAAAHRPPPTSCQAYGKQVKLGLNDHFHLFNSLSACYVLSFDLTFEIFNIYPIHLMTL